MNNNSFTQEELVDFYEAVSNDVKRELITHYSSYNTQQGIDNKEFLFAMEQRLEQEKLLRPFVGYMSFMVFKKELVSSQYNEVVLPLILISELFNISTYQTNYILDRKFFNSLKSPNNQLLYSYFSISMCYNIIKQLPIDNNKKCNLFALLSSCNEKVYLGQNVDLNILSFTNIDVLKNKEYAVIEQLYLKRCELLGGSTINFPLLSPFMLADYYDEKQQNDFSQIGKIYGGLMQVLNDLDDFLNSNNSDIKNGKIPCYLWDIIKKFNYNPGATINYLDTLHLEDKISIIKASGIELLIEKQFEHIENFYQKHQDLNLDNAFSIFYETIFRSNFYSQAFK